MTLRRWVAVPACAACVSAAGAQQQTNIPIRQLVIEATSTETFPSQGVSAWQWPDGGIVVTSRARNGRLVLFDKDMKLVRVIADSTLIVGSMIAFSTFVAMPYAGDTTVVVDPGNRGLLFIDRDGKQIRITALPRANDMNNISTGQFGNYVDTKGRFVYRSAYARQPVAPDAPPPKAGALDSSVVVRADFDRRAVDTLMAVRNLSSQIQISSENDGVTTTRTMLMTPNTWNDDWTMLGDGTIAVVRAQDYHIEWLFPDGTRSSTPKMPFDWRRLTDEEKQAKLDTAKRQNGMIDSITNRPRPDGRPSPLVTKRVYATIKDIPDFYPPLMSGSATRVLGDTKNRVWIVPSTSAQARGGVLLDVVNKQGVIEERVQLPANAMVIGFGTNDTVILRILQPDRTNTIARARIVR